MSETDEQITESGSWACSEELAEVAELAQACRFACEASKEELHATSVRGASNGAEDGSSDNSKTDLTRLSLGTGNEYIKGALVLIAMHLGLGSSSQQSTHWRKKEESSVLAVATLKFLVSGEFCSPG